MTPLKVLKTHLLTIKASLEPCASPKLGLRQARQVNIVSRFATLHLYWQDRTTLCLLSQEYLLEICSVLTIRTQTVSRLLNTLTKIPKVDQKAPHGTADFEFLNLKNFCEIHIFSDFSI